MESGDSAPVSREAGGHTQQQPLCDLKYRGSTRPRWTAVRALGTTWPQRSRNIIARFACATCGIKVWAPCHTTRVNVLSKNMSRQHAAWQQQESDPETANAVRQRWQEGRGTTSNGFPYGPVADMELRPPVFGPVAAVWGVLSRIEVDARRESWLKWWLA